MNKSTLLFLFFFTAVLFTSCKKDEAIVEVDPCLSETPKDVALEFKLYYNNLPFQLNTDYTLSDGKHVVFHTSQFYLSGIQLLKDTVPHSGDQDVDLITPSSLNSNLGKYELGIYSGIRFDFGIDSLRNHADPTVYPTGHPLAIQVPSMHWSWNQGYLFAIMEGKYSSDSITTNNPGNDFSYHIGLDGNYRTDITLTFNNPLNIKACDGRTIHLKANLATVFNGLDISTDNNTQSTINYGLSTRVRNNIVAGISTDQ